MKIIAKNYLKGDTISSIVSADTIEIKSIIGLLVNVTTTINEKDIDKLIEELNIIKNEYLRLKEKQIKGL